MKKRKIFIIFSMIMIFVISFGFIGINVGAKTLDNNTTLTTTEETRNWPMPSEWEQYNLNKLFIPNTELVTYKGLNYYFNNGILFINGTCLEDYNIYISLSPVINGLFTTYCYLDGNVDSDFYNPYIGLADGYVCPLDGTIYTDSFRSIPIYFSCTIKKGISYNCTIKVMLLEGNYNIKYPYQPNLNYLVDKVGNDAFNTGFSVGTSEGYNEGYSKGFDDGLKEGYDNGYLEGLKINANALPGGLFNGAFYQSISLDDPNIMSAQSWFVNGDYGNNCVLGSVLYNSATEEPGIVDDMGSYKLKVVLEHPMYFKDVSIRVPTCLDITFYLDNGNRISFGREVTGYLSLSDTLDFPYIKVQAIDFIIKNVDDFNSNNLYSYDSSYQYGYEMGLRTGKQEGYNKGYSEGKKVGFDNGFIEGQNSIQDIPLSFASLLETIFLFPVKFLTEGMNVEIFGINIGSVVLGVMCFSLLIFVIEFIKKYFK